MVAVVGLWMWGTLAVARDVSVAAVRSLVAFGKDIERN
jgi:hypothetical protein